MVFLHIFVLSRFFLAGNLEFTAKNWSFLQEICINFKKQEIL